MVWYSYLQTQLAVWAIVAFLLDTTEGHLEISDMRVIAWEGHLEIGNMLVVATPERDTLGLETCRLSQAARSTEGIDPVVGDLEIGDMPAMIYVRNRFLWPARCVTVPVDAMFINLYSSGPWHLIDEDYTLITAHLWTHAARFMDTRENAT